MKWIMVIVTFLVIAGCEKRINESNRFEATVSVEKFEDNKEGVVCYTYSEGIYKSFDHGTQFPVATDWDGNEKVLVAGVPRRDFEELWRGLYPEGLKSWGMAPWVWVIDFEVVK